MPKKYHIEPKNADPRFTPVGKFATVEFREDCAGSCHACVKKACVYNVFKDNSAHWSAMTEPDYHYICKNCYRCVEDCTKGIFSMAVNPEYKMLGDDYWTPGIISSTWAQAHTGKVPVSGAGYRGPFTGEGFDSIWTDMSEIVRPTRDGIHGREYISTLVELSRRPMRLKFNADKSLATAASPILEIPLPVMLQEPGFGVLSQNELLAMAAAASAVNTLMLIKPGSYTADFDKYAASLVPSIKGSEIETYSRLINQSRMVELLDEPGIEQRIIFLRSAQPQLFISVALPLDAQAAARANELAKFDIDSLHFRGGEQGREVEANNPRYMKDLIREIHLKLVESKLRNKINLIFSGGMAMAEHMAKSLICGADAVAIDVPLLIALECQVCYRCKAGKSCPVKLGEVEVKWAAQRIVNLLSAWHSQLLEVMGACGIREARRMRGEVGRSMWFGDLERDSFSPLFGSRKVSGIG